MKLLRQTALAFREGSSDKVYEVDLCEVAPGRHVVNFRFGRRGSKLQEGSKTPLPVLLPEAERIFDKLVAEKTGKGYRPSSGAVASDPAPTTPDARVEDVEDPRHQRIVDLLRTGGRGGWTRNVERLVWRAGELRIRAAAPLIAALAPATDLRAWNVARALLRCSDRSVVPTVRALRADPKRPPWVRSMAGHALAILLEGAERDTFLQEVEADIPDAIVAAVAAGRWTPVVGDLGDAPEILDQLYLLDRLRPQVVELLGHVPLASPTFLGIRRVWKAAEARGDGEVYGIVARRFEVERAGPPSRSRVRGGFLAPTRKYLRRRAWRTLRRLGEAGMAAEYCALATGVLLPFVDAGGLPDGERPADPGDGRPSKPPAASWVFLQILFGSSARITFDLRHLRAHVQTRVVAPNVREESFPALWDAQPDQLSLLLDRSRHADVHRFAARALRANRTAWYRIPIDRLIRWFDAPYPETGELAAEVALTRYDPKEPDLQLVLALLSSPHDLPRRTAETWVKANPAVFLGDVPFVVGLVLNPQAATRRLALEVLGASALLPNHARGVIEAVLTAAARSQPTGDEETTLRLRDAAAVLLAAFARELSDWPIERVAELIRHPVAGVAELGIKILLGHRIRPSELPDDLLAAAMTSIHPVVRGIGIRLYGELSDAVLAERFRVLVHLVTNPWPDVRTAVTPIVVRLASGNRGFAKVLLGALVPALATEGAEGMHRDVVRLLRTDLAGVLPLVEPSQVFRLLRSPETVVQELGGELLRTNVDPTAMTPFQLGILASSDVLGVRRTAWSMLALRVEDVRRDPESVLPLLEARWEDSRERAFRFVENDVGMEHLTPEVALAVCDSVRPEVQAFGRRLVVARFDHADGLRYLLRLAQHPSADMQAFAASWLEQHATGDPARIERLAPFFASVLLRPNKGRIAKLRVLAFLENELGDPRSAAVIAALVSELVLTVASSHRERYVAMLARIRSLHPEIPNPLRVVEPEVRGAV